MNMNQDAKDDLYDQAIVEFEKSLQLALKKFSVMKKKVGEIQDIMHDFKQTTSKMESLYMRDANQRKQYYLDHPNLVGGKQVNFGQPVKKVPNVDFGEIHKIFDEIEREESRSTIGILFSVANIIMMTVIGFSAFLFLKVEQSSRGKRVD